MILRSAYNLVRAKARLLAVRPTITWRSAYDLALDLYLSRGEGAIARDSGRHLVTWRSAYDLTLSQLLSQGEGAIARGLADNYLVERIDLALGLLLSRGEGAITRGSVGNYSAERI